MISAESRPVRRRESFDTVADCYDRYRLPPPPEVVDALIAAADLREGSRVLEIGCGTGQLSVPLAQLGVELVALDLGPQLAARARRNLEALPNARVEVGSFEDWPLPARQFDAVVSASAFHWLDPEVRFAKSAAAIRPGGRLALLHVHHVRGGTPGFLEDAQPIYVKWGLSDDPSFLPPAPNDTPILYPELEQRPELSAVSRRTFEIPRMHSTEAYVGWLNTDSLVLGADEPSRRGMLREIEELIASKYAGGVARNFVYEIITAKRA